MKKILFISIILSIILPITVSAYYESSGPGDLRSTVSPSNPGINQKTNITLGSYIINLDICDIAWKQDGTQISRGIGQKSFSFTAGKLGQVVSISADLICPGRNTMNKNWLFQTNDVEFLVTAETYTPPFYKGGTRITSKSNVKIIAIPQVFNKSGELLNPETLIYNWSKNGRAMPISSGYGKNTINVQSNEIPGSTTVYTVEISTLLEEFKALKSITIAVENPILIVYENKPLMGPLYQKGIGKTLTLTSDETTLSVEPFFFSNSDIASGNIIFTWGLNNKKINSSSDGRSITLRQSDNQKGEAIISVSANSNLNLFSSTRKTLKINFGQSTSLLGF